MRIFNVYNLYKENKFVFLKINKSINRLYDTCINDGNRTWV